MPHLNILSIFFITFISYMIFGLGFLNLEFNAIALVWGMIRLQLF